MNAAAAIERGGSPALVWRDLLPEVRGRLAFDAPLAPLTWFKVGGPADVLFQPADEADLVRVLAALDPAVPITVLGYGSNVIVRDGGIAGLVVRLPKSFARIEIHHCRIIAGAAAGDVLLANTAAEAGIAGFEFLRGIPGTIGGAVRSNAGAFGGELSDVVRRIRIHDRAQGSSRWVAAEEFAFGYRKSAIPREWVVLALEMEGRPDSREKIARRMEALIAERERSQPLRTRTGG
ncbi:MAG: FAD-binding protein, partial [Alphaproteobacteria bacterium]